MRFRPPAVALEHVDDPQRVLVVAEAPAEALVQRTVERLLAGVPERRMAEVVAQPDRLGQVLVQPQRPRDGARDPGGLERVGEPRAVVVALRVDEHLRLVLEPPEGLRVDDPVAVALERRAQAAWRLVRRAIGRIGAGGERSELLLLQVADPGLERPRYGSICEGMFDVGGVGLHANDSGSRIGRSGPACSRPLAHGFGQRHRRGERPHHHREVRDLALAVESQQVETLDLLVADPGLEDERLRLVTVELIRVPKVLESAKNHAQQRRYRRASLERLEGDRAVEDDVVGERIHHPVGSLLRRPA